MVIAVVLRKKLLNEAFPASKFRMPRVLGIVVNVIALCFLVVAFVFLFFPTTSKPDAAGMNWAVLIYGVAVLSALGYYQLHGKHQYDVSLYCRFCRDLFLMLTGESRVPCRMFGRNMTHPMSVRSRS